MPTRQLGPTRSNTFHIVLLCHGLRCFCVCELKPQGPIARPKSVLRLALGSTRISLSIWFLSHLSHLSHHELFQFPSNRLQLLRLYSWICGFSHSLIVPRWSKSEYVLFSYIVLFVFVGSPGLKHAIYGSKMIWKRTYVPTSRIEQIKVIPLGLQLLPVDSIDSPGRLG